MGIAAAALFAAGPALAASVQPFDDTRKLCAGQSARLERLEGIPRHLLSAISVAESGRWDETRQATFAWPWTVTAEGEGRFFATKAGAVDHVRALRARDVRNIDVGCMQVNLYYHGGAFAGLEEAFDPPTNVAYAARYLKGLFDAARSWTQAAADYHSTTPERNRPYKRKVVRLWNQIRRDAAAGDRPARPVRFARPPAIDIERTAAVDGAPSIVLEVAPADAGRLVTVGVEERLAQVFLNIIANAKSFSPPGGVITITARRGRDDVEVAEPRVLRDSRRDQPGGGDKRQAEAPQHPQRDRHAGLRQDQRHDENRHQHHHRSPK